MSTISARRFPSAKSNPSNMNRLIGVGAYSSLCSSVPVIPCGTGQAIPLQHGRCKQNMRTRGAQRLVRTCNIRAIHQPSFYQPPSRSALLSLITLSLSLQRCKLLRPADAPNMSNDSPGPSAYMHCVCHGKCGFFLLLLFFFLIFSLFFFFPLPHFRLLFVEMEIPHFSDLATRMHVC